MLRYTDNAILRLKRIFLHLYSFIKLENFTVCVNYRPFKINQDLYIFPHTNNLHFCRHDPRPFFHQAEYIPAEK